MTTSAQEHPSAWPEAGPDVLTPIAEHDDLREVARAIFAASEGASAWGLLAAELGVAGMAVPEDLGGSGYGVRELAVVLEEAGSALSPDPLISSAVLGTQALALAEDPDAVGDLLAGAIAGDLVVTLWDGPAVEARVDDGWRVDADLPRVLHGGSAQHVVVPARSEAGEVLLVVEVPPGCATSRTVLDPTRAQADLALRSAPARVVASGASCAATSARLAVLRDVAVAAEHTGIVGHLLDTTVDYVRGREQFGRPIGSFQAVKHRLADVLVDRERCRSAARYAAAVYDAQPATAAVAATVAAALCADAVMRTAHETVQLHGGIGFTWEHPAHLYLRRALGDEGIFGSAHDHRIRLAGLLGL